MKIHHHLYKLAHNLSEITGIRPRTPQITQFAMNTSEIVSFRGRCHSGVREAFLSAQRRPVHKWAHYLEIYDRFFSAQRGKPITFLEIGVMDGGSLDMWRRYFGENATIIGIDIDPACSSRVDPPNHVRIGSQDDPDFLMRVVDEFGAPDIVLDDGSHIGRHQAASFETLFPALKNGGLYAIEDLHTSYWPSWEGGYRRKGSGIEFVKDMIDDLHGWYHNRPARATIRDFVNSIQIFDSVAVIEKTRKQRPGFLSSQS